MWSCTGWPFATAHRRAAARYRASHGFELIAAELAIVVLVERHRVVYEHLGAGWATESNTRTFARSADSTRSKRRRSAHWAAAWIAISPAAMEVSRIGPISPGMLQFWRVGVLLIGLPALVLLAGVGVYWSRRD